MPRLSSSRERERVPLAKRWARLAARTRVQVSLIALAVALGVADPSRAALTAGCLLAAAGLAVRAWAAGHLRKDLWLARTGPYAHVRNPLYVGSLLCGAGLGLASGHGLVLIAIIAIFVLWFRPVIAEEESHLREILPGYREYQQAVPRLVPSLRPRTAGDSRFSWEAYRHNREFRAALAFAVCFGYLWLRLTPL